MKIENAGAGTVKNIEKNMALIEANIESVYRHARSMMDQREFSIGLNWYRNVGEQLRRRARANGLTLYQTASAFSALSPQVSFSRNLEMLDQLLAGDTVAGLGSNIDKAKTCLTLDDAGLDALWRQPKKTASFALNLAKPSTSRVTLDRHALKIAGIDALTVAGRAYTLLEQCYQNVAERIGLKPYELQAVTWTYWRGGAY